MRSSSIARQDNKAWDLGDFTEFDRVAALSGRDLDRAIEEMSSEHIEALLEITALHRGQGVYS
jgi:hypothetical protein